MTPAWAEASANAAPIPEVAPVIHHILPSDIFIPPADISCFGYGFTPAACLLYSPLRGSSIWRFSGRSEEAVHVSVSVRANNSEVLREAAIGGMGLIMMPSWLVGADIEAGRLRTVLPAWEPNLDGTGGAIYAVYLANRRSSKKVRAFVDFLIARFGSPPYWDANSGS